MKNFQIDVLLKEQIHQISNHKEVKNPSMLTSAIVPFTDPSTLKQNRPKFLIKMAISTI